jgi:hypothetical protein
MLQLTYLTDRREVSHKYSGVACSYNSKNDRAGWPELPLRQLSLFKSMIAGRHTTVPEMFSALATKIMFWALALARVIFSTAKIISWSNKLFFHGLPSKLLLKFNHNYYWTGSKQQQLLFF